MDRHDTRSQLTSRADCVDYHLKPHRFVVPNAVTPPPTCQLGIAAISRGRASVSNTLTSNRRDLWLQVSKTQSHETCQYTEEMLRKFQSKVHSNIQVIPRFCYCCHCCHGVRTTNSTDKTVQTKQYRQRPEMKTVAASSFEAGQAQMFFL